MHAKSDSRDFEKTSCFQNHFSTTWSRKLRRSSEHTSLQGIFCEVRSSNETVLYDEIFIQLFVSIFKIIKSEIFLPRYSNFIKVMHIVVQALYVENFFAVSFMKITRLWCYTSLSTIRLGYFHYEVAAIHLLNWIMFYRMIKRILRQITT